MGLTDGDSPEVGDMRSTEQTYDKLAEKNEKRKRFHRRRKTRDQEEKELTFGRVPIPSLLSTTPPHQNLVPATKSDITREVFHGYFRLSYFCSRIQEWDGEQQQWRWHFTPGKRGTDAT